jgi:L,D-peptidoglycan transpeptidase YkuD (ErfK/YbiS/YcfS/YnhG family)
MLLRILILSTVSFLSASAFELPADSKQCLIGIAEDWQSSNVTLCLYQKIGADWRTVNDPWSGRLGKNGLVWGNGISPNPAGAVTKKEGDGCSPAGVFAIGGAWGYKSKILKHPLLPYRQVTVRDLWVEDSNSPQYNRHVILDHDPTSAWEKKQQMKQTDPFHSLKLFIAHNAPPKVTRNAGSSIYFHIWRGGGTKATAGCTTMDESKLKRLISNIDPSCKPIYVLLPKLEYEKYRSSWKLPPSPSILN